MQGTLANRLQNLFLPQDQQRGQQYFDAGLVDVQDDVGGELLAYVEGSDREPYTILIDLEIPLSLRCDCPRFADGFNCKHLWATILAWDQMVGDAPSGQRRKSRPLKSASSWQRQLETVKEVTSHATPVRRQVAQELVDKKTCYWFAICLEDHVEWSPLEIRLFQSQAKMNGEWGKPQRRGISRDDHAQLTDPIEIETFALLQPGHDRSGQRYGYSFITDSLFGIPAGLHARVFELLSKSGRFVWSVDNTSLDNSHSLVWDDGPAWALAGELRSVPEEKEPLLELVLQLSRPGETRALSSAVFAFCDGLVLFPNEIARLQPQAAGWIRGWQTAGPIRLPADQLDSFLSQLANLPHLPNLQFDAQLDVVTSAAKPNPKVVISHESHSFQRGLTANIWMKYGGTEIEIDDDRSVLWDAERRAWCDRDDAEEARWAQQLAPFVSGPQSHSYRQSNLTLGSDVLPKLVMELTAAGWEVVAHGKLMRQARGFNIEVSSGTDWFDLNAAVDFGGVTASLPELLAAVKQRKNFILLDDGSQGMLPDDWLKQYARLAEVGETEGDSVRFAKSQALLLDAMLAERESVTADQNFTSYCRKLASFDGIQPEEAPRGFHGELRQYQKDGLGWLSFLREYQLGGCLADDMGLGKTVQVLAMLQGRRAKRLKKTDERRPSIAVVPKSLIFNWIDEAARFAPRLRILNYTGQDRCQQLDQLGGGDLLITTYGTLLRDIEMLSEVQFDYAILDEAQAIKNSNSQSAKACRLLRSQHRLALTGTPIENHLGELWSLFDFLNPGMLGRVKEFRNLTSVPDGDTASIGWLRRALKPFILRRTKQQVLTELPEKVEQTLYCEMKPKQQKLYQELRDHYRSHLTKKVDRVGIKRSKIHVLEALLRLRQAACDPRLIDNQQDVDGAKIGVLLEQLAEVLDEGHKALVFSQFTSLLALVRAELDARDWTYEYLDGKTLKRGERVKRFQEDNDCKLFLISLKAGGHGLNLTAADYVYILDPWWNPAVEAQAIDRAHRMGQTRHVNAYRIICRDTVEDKIVELQRSKRDLADAIIAANESLIAQLSLEDLQALFS